MGSESTVVYFFSLKLCTCVAMLTNLCAEFFYFILFCVYEEKSENLVSWSMLKRGFFMLLLRSTNTEKCNFFTLSFSCRHCQGKYMCKISVESKFFTEMKLLDILIFLDKRPGLWEIKNSCQNICMIFQKVRINK